MDSEIEQFIKDCASIRGDQSKCAKSRKIARLGIEISHGVIDLKEENARLIKQIEELRAKLKALNEMPEAT